LARRLAK